MAGSTRNWPLIEPYLGVGDDEDLECEPWLENPVIGELLRVFGRGNSRDHRAQSGQFRRLTKSSPVCRHRGEWSAAPDKLW